jgi:hypothetical protein
MTARVARRIIDTGSRNPVPVQTAEGKSQMQLARQFYSCTSLRRQHTHKKLVEIKFAGCRVYICEGFARLLVEFATRPQMLLMCSELRRNEIKRLVHDIGRIFKSFPSKLLIFACCNRPLNCIHKILQAFICSFSEATTTLNYLQY